MADLNQKNAAKKFVEEWRGRGQEDEDCRSFWIELAESVLGIETPTKLMSFEKKVKIKGGSTKRIDVYIPSAKVMIEQKSLNIDLDKPQQGHDGQTPFQQAKFYNDFLNFNERARWIIVSNFTEIRIHDMDNMQADPLVIMLDELPEKLSAFDILKVEKKDKIIVEEQISVRAGEITGKLYDALVERYSVKDEETFRSLNQLCVRLVFCLYAEDANVFADKQFHDYLEKFAPEHIRTALKNLFKMLDTPDSERDPDDEPELLAFPYVNGGLFADETIRIPQFNEELKALLLDEASLGIDWSGISPTIFGAVFESTLNPETRRSGGMHYTSIENIHKVIDPLFLDDLRAELSEILALKQGAAIKKRVSEFQKKLSELVFLDPACGSGNFLTETYLSLRRLENKALALLYKEQIVIDTGNIIRVSIEQFNGIEINDFAVTVAKTALWIAESQMIKETEEIVHIAIDFLPLKTDATIIKENALRIDWESVVPKSKLNYILGNPPFVGYYLQNKSQKNDLLSVYTDENGKPYQSAGKIDYVAAWYFKAAQLMADTKICTSFVSTNSITQGEQTALVWKPLFERFNVHIDYAWRTFKWGSESNETAAVHCVIVGFSCFDNRKKRIIFDGKNIIECANINPYLIAADNIFVESRKKPICDVPEMCKGSIPVDDGNLLLDEQEYNHLIKSEPNSAKFIKPFLGAREFLHNEKRWCLWLVNANPSELLQLHSVMQRIERVKNFRLKSTKEATKKYAQYPTRFMEIRQPNSDYILFPSHSSENREYIPIGFMSSDIVCGNANLLIPNATLYEFGILMSGVHNAWIRAVCGRLEMRYRYSVNIVYNNFPWCSPTPAQKTKIEQTAQAILDARAKYPDSSLADLYDELTMPKELRKAHQENDKAVMKAYGFSSKMSEQEIVAELMKMYRNLTQQ